MNLPNNVPCPQCGRFANRGVTVDAVIFSDKKVLLIKRGADPFKGYWALPGGYVGWNETTADAVRREAEEEVGIRVINVKEIGVYSDPKRHPKQCINIAYYAEVKGEPKAGDDATEFKYFPLNGLPKDLAFDHKKIIRDCQKILS